MYISFLHGSEVKNDKGDCNQQRDKLEGKSKGLMKIKLL